MTLVLKLLFNKAFYFQEVEQKACRGLLSFPLRTRTTQNSYNNIWPLNLWQLLAYVAWGLEFGGLVEISGKKYEVFVKKWYCLTPCWS